MVLADDRVVQVKRFLVERFGILLQARRHVQVAQVGQGRCVLEAFLAGRSLAQFEDSVGQRQSVLVVTERQVDEISASSAAASSRASPGSAWPPGCHGALGECFGLVVVSLGDQGSCEFYQTLGDRRVIGTVQRLSFRQPVPQQLHRSVEQAQPGIDGSHRVRQAGPNLGLLGQFDVDALCSLVKQLAGRHVVAAGLAGIRHLEYTDKKL